MKHAFSLIESLVVIAVIIITSGTFIITSNQYYRMQALSLTTEQIKSSINQVYSLSLTPEAGISGYGVKCFKTTSKCITYKNISPNIYTYSTNTNNTKEINTYKFQSGVEIANDSDAFFTVPKPNNSQPYYKETHFNGSLYSDENLYTDKGGPCNKTDQTCPIILTAFSKNKTININVVTNYVEIK